MDLRHIIVATDESDAGRQAVRTGLDLASRAAARLTIMRAVSVPALPTLVGVSGVTGPTDVDGGEVALQRLERWLQADVIPAGNKTPVEIRIAFGIPGIEISRFAERENADLLVLGRKRRSQAARLLLGDTADAVVRRSRVPCLFVAPNTGSLRQVLVALDGSERGLRVLTEASGFARSVGASLRVVTVEYVPAGEPEQLGSALPVASSSRLRDQVRPILARELTNGAAKTTVVVRRGPVVQQILTEVAASEPDALAVGYHRGGPPGVIEAGSTARHLAHTAPCAVFTVPL
jgi:nucleotide-binding universal stress UspA family protein